MAPKPSSRALALICVTVPQGEVRYTSEGRVIPAVPGGRELHTRGASRDIDTRRVQYAGRSARPCRSRRRRAQYLWLTRRPRAPAQGIGARGEFCGWKSFDVGAPDAEIETTVSGVDTAVALSTRGSADPPLRRQWLTRDSQRAATRLLTHRGYRGGVRYRRGGLPA